MLTKKQWWILAISTALMLGIWCGIGILTKDWFAIAGRWQPIASLAILFTASIAIVLTPALILHLFWATPSKSKKETK